MKEIEVTIEKIIPGGEGLARVDGKIVFIPQALPGELVRARICEETTGWMRSLVPEIIEAAAERRVPFCPIYDRCGGCNWQHMSYPLQLSSKTAIVREALLRQGGFTREEIPDDIPVVKSPETGYRSRIRPIIGSGGIPAFRSKGSGDTVSLSFCPVAAKAVNRFLESPPEGLEEGTEPIVFGDQNDYWLEGRDREARTRIANRDFVFPVASFFQSNLFPLPALVDFVLGSTSGSGARLALDLFGGAGLFGAFLADRFDEVIGIDQDKRVKSSWKRNVGTKGHCITTTLETWARRVGPRKPDFIVVDPPRSGLSAGVRRALVQLDAPTLVYVSCDPVTQARDLKDFRNRGYQLEAFSIFDLYPQTAHVETVARLVKKERSS